MRRALVLVMLLLVGGVAAAQTPDPGSGSGSGSGSATPPIIIQLPTDASAPKVTAAAAPTIVAVGAPFTVFLKATYQAGVEVNLREPVELGGNFEVRKKVSETTKGAFGTITREWQLQVIAWDIGDVVMPGIAVTYTAFGKADQIASNAINLKVVGLLGDLVDDPKARDAHPPTDLVRRDWFWLYAGGAAGIVLVGVILYLWIRARRRRRTYRLTGGSVSMPLRIDTTSTRALERLLAIEKSGVLDRVEDRKRGYAEMAEVIRDYLAGRYRIATHDLTTSELMRNLKPAAPKDELAMVETWLEGGDLVKYGGLRPTAIASNQQLADARALIVATTTPLASASGSNLPKVAA